MTLVRLIYTSTASENFDIKEVESVLESARRINHDKAISGILCFNRNYFLQCLEGERESVNDLYIKISKDPRHHSVTLMHYEEISEREFENWSMGYIPESSVTSRLNTKYSGSIKFLPYSMSGASAHKYLMVLKDTIPTL